MINTHPAAPLFGQTDSYRLKFALQRGFGARCVRDQFGKWSVIFGTGERFVNGSTNGAHALGPLDAKALAMIYPGEIVLAQAIRLLSSSISIDIRTCCRGRGRQQENGPAISPMR